MLYQGISVSESLRKYVVICISEFHFTLDGMCACMICSVLLFSESRISVLMPPCNMYDLEFLIYLTVLLCTAGRAELIRGTPASPA
jgi:hypothetical protein